MGRDVQGRRPGLRIRHRGVHELADVCVSIRSGDVVPVAFDWSDAGRNEEAGAARGNYPPELPIPEGTPRGRVGHDQEWPRRRRREVSQVCAPDARRRDGAHDRDMRLHRCTGQPQDWQERSHAPTNTPTRQGPVVRGAARQCGPPSHRNTAKQTALLGGNRVLCGQMEIARERQTLESRETYAVPSETIDFACTIFKQHPVEIWIEGPEEIRIERDVIFRACRDRGSPRP